jgi:hypothetical protein
MKFCTSCGQQLTEGTRFCENCGAAVPQAAAPTPVPTAAVTAPTAEFAAAPAGRAPAPAVAGKPTDHRRLLTVLGVLAAAAVLAVVGYFVVDRLTGPNGGADTPSAAVLELSAAAGAEDPLTALSLLPPEEVGPIVDLYKDVESVAVSSGIASAESPFAGFDLRLDSVRVDVEELGEDVAAVTVTSGSIAWQFDPAKVREPLRMEQDGDLRESSEGSADLVEVAAGATDGAPLRIMTIEQDGRWYVSPMYTLLEAWRVGQGLPAPDFSEPFDYEGTGSDSATAAVEDAVQAVTAFDVDGFLDQLSPGEAGALYRYRATIAAALNRDGLLAEARSEVALNVDAIETSAGEEVDGRVPVTVRTASGSVVAGDDYYDWSLDRNCVSVRDDGGTEGVCLDEAFAEAGLSPEMAAQFPELRILTIEEDGRWYLSPLATLVSSARNAVADLEGDDVLAALGVPQFGTVTGELTEGVPVEGSLADPSDHALYEVDVPAGEVLDVCVDGDVDSRVYGLDRRPSPGGAMTSADGGTYRVLVRGQGSGQGFTVEAATSAVEDLAVPGRLTGSGEDTCGRRVVRVQGTAGQPLMFTSDGDDVPVVTTPSGETASGSVLVPTETGEYLVSVAADADFAVEALTADVLAAGDTEIDNLRTASFLVSIEAGQTLDIQAYYSMYEGSIGMRLTTLDGDLVDAASSSRFGYGGSARMSVYSSTAEIYQLTVTGSNATEGFDVTVGEDY